MSVVNGFSLILVYQLAGEVSVRLLGLPLPGPLMGMLMLFCTLVANRRLARGLEGVSATLLGHLSLLFVPAGVGVITHVPTLQQQGMAIVAAMVVSTLLTLAVSALLMKWLLGSTVDER
ncbi:CidA/LrgA family protein [Ferrimonas sediminicola]|uniref:CidA/LrgA family protein n=1 Tax=Ferrimonas sediminicola TaxID=2569538 RepID=A0A4U1BH22_9GAMM|nr:CidA/LrgA family protein [Ferrimonas sediminicola]TKB50545.1 CidA/LrgA family protein [Ferrimonas sediminicola]